jgi:hypothetical protein
MTLVEALLSSQNKLASTFHNGDKVRILASGFRNEMGLVLTNLTDCFGCAKVLIRLLDSPEIGVEAFEPQELRPW